MIIFSLKSTAWHNPICINAINSQGIIGIIFNFDGQIIFPKDKLLQVPLFYSRTMFSELKDNYARVSCCPRWGSDLERLKNFPSLTFSWCCSTCSELEDNYTRVSCCPWVNNGTTPEVSRLTFQDNCAVIEDCFLKWVHNLSKGWEARTPEGSRLQSWANWLLWF